MSINYHVEVVADLGSFGQVPHVNVAIMAGRKHDAGVKWVSLQHKHLIIMTLEQRDHKHSGQSVGQKQLFYSLLHCRNACFSHSQIKYAAAVQWLCSTL